MRIKVSAIIIVILTLWSCVKVPITGRKQMKLLPESELITMANAQYAEFLTANQVLNNSQAAQVKRVGDRIAKAVEKFLTKEGHGKRIEGYQWEFNLVKDSLVNAWCMPGGKVVFYTGILPVCQGDEGIAVVMGHEIAHAIARHGNERMSQGLLVNLGAASIGVATSQNSEMTQQIFNQSYGLASTLGMLKYSRKHESEADKLGLVFMALAGYNPETAVGFWQRMSEGGGVRPPEILSTHPSSETRIEEIKKFLPEAKKYYKPVN